MYRKAAILLFSFLICFGCREKPEEPDAEFSVQDAIEFSEIQETCGDVIFAAIYFIPDTNHLIKNGDFWIGQPAHAFQELLSEEQKREILNDAERLLQENNSSAIQISKTLNNWCVVYYTLEEFQETASIEELLEKLAEEPVITDYMNEYSERFKTIAEEYNTRQAVSSLSSAEILDLYGRIITNIASPGFIQLDQVIKSLTSNQNGMTS